MTRRNGMEWNGMEWNGMERNGTEWNGMTRATRVFRFLVLNIIAVPFLTVMPPRAYMSGMRGGPGSLSSGFHKSSLSV